MKTSLIRESLILTPSEWQALSALAARFWTVPPTGPNTTEPSWRTLIKAIANGEITLKRAPSEHTEPDK
jgi:hypothetical protein